MKQYLFFCFGLLLFSPVNAQNNDTLTNETIIKLHQAGFSTEILRSKINTSPAKFDVSLDGMLKLKEKKIPEEIINMMISNPNGLAEKNISSPGNDENKSFITTGIFYLKPPAEPQEMQVSYISSKITDKSIQLLSPLFSGDIKVILTGTQSAFEIAEKIPKFRFVFDTLKNNTDNPWFGKSLSPKNFFLVKLKPTKKNRELLIGKTSAIEERVEITDKQKIPLKTKTISKGVYELSPVSPLEDGEYGFIFSNAVWDTQSGKIYDFRIK